MSRIKLQRRTFLTAMALGVSAPLAASISRLATAAPTGALTRLLNIYIPHGIPWEFASPFLENGSLDLMAKGDTGVFAPLQPFASQVNMLRGIAMAAGASNHTAIKTMLTGSAAGTADSYDYNIAKQLDTKAFALGAAPRHPTQGFNPDCELIRHGGQWVRAQASPVAAADELFFGLGDDAPGAPDESVFREEAMGLSALQVERLRDKVQGLSTEDSKLKKHLDALLELKQGHSSASTCSERPTLDRVEATRLVDPLDPTQFGKVFDAQLEAAGTAMLCGAAQVLTLQALYVNSNLVFNFSGGPGLGAGHHQGLSHGSRPDFAQAQRWFMERIAAVLLPILDQDDPSAPGSTVLDNSIVYISSEVSDPNDHNSQAGEVYVAGVPIYATLPQILIGGAAGQFKSGGHVINVEEDRPHSDVMATIASAMGTSLPAIDGAATTVITELQS